MLCRHLFMLCCCLTWLVTPSLMASEREAILCIGDDQLGDLFRDLERASAETRHRRGIVLEAEKKRALTAAQLDEDLERLVLDESPTRALIAVGAYDLWDFRKDQAIEGATVADVVGRIGGIVERLGAAEIAVTLATPLAGPADGLQRSTMAELAEALRSAARQRGAECFDAFAITAAETAYGRRGRLEKATEQVLVEGLIATLGLASSNLPPLQAHDRVVWFGEFHPLDKWMKPFESAFEVKHPEVDLVFVAKDLDKLVEEEDFIVNQQPKVLLLNYGTSQIRQATDATAFGAELRALIQQVGAMDKPPVQLVLVTPVPPNAEDNDGGWKPDGPYAEMAAAFSDEVKAVATEYRLPVLDLHATCVALAATQPQLAYFVKQDGKNWFRPDAGIAVALTALLKQHWGVATAE